jgi:DNA polymerase-3 subunit epsilon
MTRLVALDTESTGLKSKEGDRLVEIAMVDITRGANPRHFHSYLNPGDREVNPEALAVHGLSNEFLKDAPTFEEVLPKILEYLDGDPSLVIHNAPFDVGFLRDECLLVGQVWPEFAVIDTLKEAAKKFPGARHSLDALCNRFGVDTSSRTKHGALVDTTILKDLYLAWFGQGGFDLEATISIVAKEEISNLGALNSILVAARGEADAAPVTRSWDDFFAKNAV